MVTRSPVCSLSHPAVEQEERLGEDGAYSSAVFPALSGSGRTSVLGVAVGLSLLSTISFTHLCEVRPLWRQDFVDCGHGHLDLTAQHQLCRTGTRGLYQCGSVAHEGQKRVSLPENPFRRLGRSLSLTDGLRAEKAGGDVFEVISLKKKLLHSLLENCRPLSMCSSSGHPHLAKMFFSRAQVVPLVMSGR